MVHFISCMNVTLVWYVAKAARRARYSGAEFTCSVPAVTVRLNLLILFGKYSNRY